MRKDREVHGLMKIPHEVIISELRLELGKANAMIVELNEAIKIFSKWNKNLLSNDISNHETINRLQKEVKRQQKANTKLMRSIYKLKHNTP